ncbi:hypothetical protein D1224_06520 [Henriciella barbarensis]|uniref:4-O-methyl-glucuronoyl methylesterase-like domain-containing protein n=1 Tax=Henriciella barbarensis TaxID=86342 RepID=A0A399QY96_9PROT|nr:hypothetical protein [Henriciella barbarensis]RIJ23900.1 hypothetical protein D1224_06520 [Henriciella barbarensis]
MALIFKGLSWTLRLVVGAVLLVLMTNCTMLGLNYASLEVDSKPDARPEITATALSEWEDGRNALIETFETFVYGPWPEGQAVRLVSRTMIDDGFAGGRGSLEELVIEVGSDDGARRFHVALALPESETPVPLIISQTFSSNCGAFPGATLTAPGGGDCADHETVPGFVEAIFGEFIALVPIEQYFDRGYGYATWQAGEFIPDRQGEAQAVMDAMAGDGVAAPTGTLAGWGYGFSAIIDALEGDPAINADAVAVMGHSRHAKSAMVAAVYDRRISAVVSHQSGFGGAASSRSETGETVERMVDGARALGVLSMEGYPHWFAPAFADYASHTEDLPVDQHQFIALVAPTPMLLGNGRRDVWSDPNSTYRMAEAADPVYELYGTQGLDQDGMRDYNPEAALSYYLRPGGHAITQRDISTFLDMLDAAMPQGNRVPDTANGDSLTSQ